MTKHEGFAWFITLLSVMTGKTVTIKDNGDEGIDFLLQNHGKVGTLHKDHSVECFGLLLDYLAFLHNNNLSVVNGYHPTDFYETIKFVSDAFGFRRLKASYYPASINQKKQTFEPEVEVIRKFVCTDMVEEPIEIGALTFSELVIAVEIHAEAGVNRKETDTLFLSSSNIDVVLIDDKLVSTDKFYPGDYL